MSFVGPLTVNHTYMFAKTEMVAIFRNPRKLFCAVDEREDFFELITSHHAER